MLDHINLKDIIFLDVETVPMAQNYSDLDENFKALWDRKALHLSKGEQMPEEIFQRAGIYAEFGKIVCISMGVFRGNGENKTFHLKSYFSDNETEILVPFCEAVGRFTARNKNALLCAHNGKEFDFPYIARRLVINGLPVPKILGVAGKKPWEVPFLDTMEFWKFGDYKSYTSLHLLTSVLNIPTPKDDIDGSMVAGVYYEDKDIQRIATYCEKDVLAVAHIMQRFKGEPIIAPNKVKRVS